MHPGRHCHSLDSPAQANARTIVLVNASSCPSTRKDGESKADSLQSHLSSKACSTNNSSSTHSNVPIISKGRPCHIHGVLAAMAIGPPLLAGRSFAADHGFLPDKPVFRYWIDFQVLSSPSSTLLLEQALRAVGGVRSGGPPKLDPVTSAVQKHKDYGYMHMDDWDFLWSITAKAMLAAEILRPGQMLSIVPGFLSISRKTSLVRTLTSAYGELAWQLVPRTFKLPDELDEWAQWVEDNPKLDRGLWMLKNNKQRGTGLRLVRTQDAFRACFETTRRPGMEGMTLYRWYLAQQYVTDPLLIHHRKFGIRVWALVPDTRPLRVYLHCNGLVLFSSQPYDPDAIDGLHSGDGADGRYGGPGGQERGAVPQGHVTNYAQNENGMVWTLARLREHLRQAHGGRDVMAQAWAKMEHCIALLFAAALPRVKEVQAQMSLPPGSCFQLFGLDFLLDSALHPWLLEANATPSMKVEHEDPATQQLIYDQKWPVVRDMVQLLGVCPQAFVRMRQAATSASAPMPGAAGSDGAPQWAQCVRGLEAELGRRGGFKPLMHLFPDETPQGLRVLPWHRLDRQLRAWAHSSPLYGAALAAG